MISICLKSQNTKLFDDFEKKLNTISIPQIYYLQKKFKIYNNFIIHYKGTNSNRFYNTFATIFAQIIIENLEKNFIKKELNYDYFYFSPKEKDFLINSTINNLNLNSNIRKKEKILKNIIKDYFSENSKCVLDGFINFRLR